MPVGDEDQVSKGPEGGWEISVSSPNHLEVMIINDHDVDTLKIF